MSNKLTVASLTCNPFQENCYILYTANKDCIIVDPGCWSREEKQRLQSFISQRGLKPVRLINTHCHIDHVLGNKFVADTYNLSLEIHEGEIPVLDSLMRVAHTYGISDVDESPAPGSFIQAGDVITLGDCALKVLFTPGHSPASVCLYEAEAGILIAGDVLFQGSIGRTDLPGGNYETLMQSIEKELLVLPDNVQVYPGHGNPTTIGAERRSNPFIKEWLAQ
jgi:glyoxylase-like metal-dependent hydrolase (beta-lactamase superfamily II)